MSDLREELRDRATIKLALVSGLLIDAANALDAKDAEIANLKAHLAAAPPVGEAWADDLVDTLAEFDLGTAEGHVAARLAILTALDTAKEIAMVDLSKRLLGPHEWGYRDPVEGGFITDNAPFEVAAALDAKDAEIARLRAERDDYKMMSETWERKVNAILASLQS